MGVVEVGINGAKEYREWRERQRVPVEIKEKAKVR